MKKYCLAFLALFSVAPIILLNADSFSLSGNPSTLTVSTATAGQQPNSATNNSTTYNLSTTTTVRSILGRVGLSMPSGLTLSVQLAAPTGATSAGSKSMTTTNQTLVSSIPTNTIQNNLTVTYTFSATAAASQVTNGSRTLTLTLQ